jgi:hypothetical protein
MTVTISVQALYFNAVHLCIAVAKNRILGEAGMFG